MSDSAVNTPPGRSRIPMQERSQQRVAAAIEAAERMIEARGPEETSIPEIAKESGVPRASLYQFFPTKYVLFAHLAERHLEQVALRVQAAADKNGPQAWRDLIVLLVNAAADYYDATPVASQLILGGPMSRSAYLAQEVTIEHIGHAVRALMKIAPDRIVLPKQPDSATLCVEIAFTCMKYGYYREGRLSKATRREAVRAATAYLSTFA
jgi:AcrR family transcriptional regulator